VRITTATTAFVIDVISCVVEIRCTAS